MNVLFLDVDGVLNSSRSFIAGGPRMKAYSKRWEEGDETVKSESYHVRLTLNTIDPIAVELINLICDECDCKLVISSTHRKHIDRGPNKLLEMQAYFDALGIAGSKHIIGWTESLDNIRGTEIELYLQEHPEVTNYVIVDDSSDMLESQKEHFVHVDGEIGFSAYDYKRARVILGNPDSDIFLF